MITKDDNNISYIFIPFHIVYDFKVVFQERVKFSMKYMTVLCKLWFFLMRNNFDEICNSVPYLITLLAAQIVHDI